VEKEERGGEARRRVDMNQEKEDERKREIFCVCVLPNFGIMPSLNKKGTKAFLVLID